MWFFNKCISLTNSGIFEGFTDWHCHILPGVDDGVQTMEESLDILRRYEQLDVKVVWLTPHIMEDVPNTPCSLRQRFEELKSAYTGNIVLHLAAEHMLDSLFDDRFAKNDLLPLGNDRNHLLVETSYFNPPMGFTDKLKRIKQRGYYPVLAHPERYAYMEHSDYRQLKSMGVLFQLNVFSLVGFYGPMVKKKAEWLLANELYDICATDIHNIEYLDEPIKQKISKKFIEPLRNIVVASIPNIWKYRINQENDHI